ncbi:hypothetical protein JVX98_13005 [Ensifer sp. PDNC004]|uniref:hypothetical protein n=1 Tax=Ensifer sp. PDNC004 TaxID=2811423 RepID=UPI001964F558|nr:hypothetical protein [Ensifer sp. PDNC004]QRY69137.1 hypothetical protein JVX98_13005 [Ensifer sp. PDNC004]
MIAVQILFAATLAPAFPLLAGVAWFCEAQFRREAAQKNFNDMTDDEIATVVLSDLRRRVILD